MADKLHMIKSVLGSKFRDDGDYILARHSNVPEMVSKGYERVGEIPDSTFNDSGTMVIFDRNPKKGLFS